MEMVDSSSNILHPKVVYNFSIPEFINHERSEERTRADSRSKRSRLQRMRHHQQSADNLPDNDNDTGDRTIEIQDSPVLVQATKKRRRAAAALAESSNVDVEEDDDDDADCHRRRQHVPVIDLTGIDSHDEFNSPLAESERRTRGERSSVIRPYPYREHRHGLNHFLSDIERTHHASRERHFNRLYCRSPSIQRFHRIQQLRRRNETRQFIAPDNVARDLLVTQSRPRNSEEERSAEATGTNDTATNADDSVLIVNEVRGTTNDDEDSVEPPLQQQQPIMEDDPSMSPPASFLSPLLSSPRLEQQLLQERFRLARQRHELALSSNLAHMEPLFNQEIQDALRTSGALRHRHERMELRNRTRAAAAAAANIHNDQATTNSGDNDPNSGTTEPHRRESTRQSERNAAQQRINAAAAAAENQREEHEEEGGEVEFIGEWNVRNSPSLRQRSSQHALLPFHLTAPIPLGIEHHHPFLRLLPAPPRLHHIFSHQENYEALLNLADTLGPGKPRGLEKSEIERIPSFRFSTNTAKETNIKCVVCISEYINREKLRRLPCSHDFHAKCIDKWLKSNKTCPVCRNEVKVASV